jgi:YidC/Oxa1 family membrane protein insertase
MWDTLIIAPFINILLFIYNLIGQNFGVAIILFTILIRLLTYPLTYKQLQGTQKMQEIQKDKRWIEIQTKYKNDKEKLAQEQMNMYKEIGYNPLSGCLPTLIQFPIIIGLYQAVIRALASTPLELLSLMGFVFEDFFDVGKLIPLNSHFLWMDLSQPERLNLPFLSFGIPVLAIVVVVTTYLQSKLMQPPQTTPGDQSAMMGNMMNIYMPFLMGYMAYTLAAGLSLYFVVSNLIGILQYALMGRLNWKNLLPKPKSSTGGTGKQKKVIDSNKSR